ncbi:competence lipoprotein [Thioalkalivibrio nitratireducens DSM 14787]|uniref:Competence lipoprotein n=1 Tax=Thioalkalivibrio nitratireducens (strain DSM 14787 / UNIQEM 213 / ALEN2) TaxID=1255043 RepID=L0E465_THIND|nr:competence lipoprotein [Thioalkalivibrio nitratireducens DSM 14787]
MLWLVGCATLPGEPRPSVPADGLEQALRAGDCRGAYDLWEAGATDAPRRLLEVGQTCLQGGDFTRARRVSAGFLERHPEHPDADYAAYLHALAGFGAWSRPSVTEPEARIGEGRRLFREITVYLRERPLSEYVENLAPRLVRLREGIADAEFALARREHRRGDRPLARARAEYVVQYYPRTQAAADAAQLLMQLADE